MDAEIPVRESLRIRVPPTGRRAAGSARPLGEAQPSGGRAVHRFGRQVVIEHVPATGARIFASSAAGNMQSRSPDFAVPPTETEKIGLAAFLERDNAQYAAAKASRAKADEGWAFERLDTPPLRRNLRFAASSGAGTSSRLSGRVAVCLHFIQGPTPDLAISASEVTAVTREIQNGLSWLATVDPRASLTWVYDIKQVSISVAANYPKTGEYESMERPWRDAALRAMGENAGSEGVRTLINRKRRHLRTDWAYAAFITKYPIAHFAYAYVGGPHLVMEPSAGSWGINNFDRVFAHESCHIFGAADEYRESRCDCGGRWGVDGAPNLNCETCNPSPAPCVMRRNEFEMCDHTRRHLGLRPRVSSSSMDVGA